MRKQTMQHTTGAFQTADNLNIYTVQWLTESKAKAVVIIVHGYSEHIERYQHVAEALVQAGYAVYGFDLRGHGKSAGGRAQVTAPTQFIDDLKRYFDTIRTAHHSDKIFLLGHSMGALISLQFALKYQNDIAGLVLTGSATDIGSTVSGLLRSIANGLHRIVPHAPIGAPLKVETISNDKDIQQRWLADTLIHKGWTPISAAKYIIDTGEMLQANAQQLVLPMLIMHGEDDQIAPLSGSRIIYERAASADKTLQTWAHMQHEILNEVERAAVLETIIKWLNKQ
jgi:acylglycerol lipase